MPSFKLTIPEGTPLWDSLGSLPAKARNAEIYRLATTALLSGNPSNGSAQNKSPSVSEKTEVVETAEIVTSAKGNFINVDFADDLNAMLSNQES